MNLFKYFHELQGLVWIDPQFQVLKPEWVQYPKPDVSVSTSTLLKANLVTTEGHLCLDIRDVFAQINYTKSVIFGQNGEFFIPFARDESDLEVYLLPSGFRYTFPKNYLMGISALGGYTIKLSDGDLEIKDDRDIVSRKWVTSKGGVLIYSKGKWNTSDNVIRRFEELLKEPLRYNKNQVNVNLLDWHKLELLLVLFGEIKRYSADGRKRFESKWSRPLKTVEDSVRAGITHEKLSIALDKLIENAKEELTNLAAVKNTVVSGPSHDDLDTAVTVILNL